MGRAVTPVKVTVATGVVAVGVTCAVGLRIVRAVTFSMQGSEAVMNTQLKAALIFENLFAVPVVPAGVLALYVTLKAPSVSKLGLGSGDFSWNPNKSPAAPAILVAVDASR
jgi:hypothetical protein